MAAQVFDATLSDGRSAAAVSVRVWAEREGLRISLPSGQSAARPSVPLFWPYDALTGNGPLLKGEPVLLGHRDHPGTRLTIDAAILPLLLERAPHLSGRRQVMRLAVPVVLAMLLVGGVLAWLWFSTFSVARVVAGMLPPELHQALGRAVVHDMSNGKVCADPDGVAALNTLLLRVVGERQQMDDYHVLAARLGMINAFAAPGGHVVLARELLEFAESAEEVAGVLAHELGHADMRHAEAGLVRALGLSVVGMLVFGDSNIGGLVLLLTQMRFSRQAELEADEAAIHRLRAAGIDPAALARFFERLQRKMGADEQGESALAALFRTHPPTRERMRALKRAALPPEQARSPLSRREWQALRNICAHTAPVQEMLRRAR